MKRPYALVLALAFISACGPSSRPELKAKVEPYFNAASAQNFGAAAKFMKPMPYAVGQFVINGITDSSGKRSVSRTAIVGKESGGWIIETYTLSDTNEGSVQMLVTGLDAAARGGSLDGIDIVWIKIKDDKGAIQKLEGPVLTMSKALYKKNLSAFDVKVAVYTNGGSVTVPAGTFAATNMVKSEVSFLGRKYKSTGWYYSGVPINGLVKSSSDDGKTSMVLLKFGLRGAKSEF